MQYSHASCQKTNQQRISMAACRLALIWRRDRDSNPGWRCRHTRVPGVPIQPLLHLSVPLYYSGCRVGWQYVWVARIYCNLLMQVFYLWECVLVLYLSVCIVNYFKYKYRGGWILFILARLDGCKPPYFLYHAICIKYLPFLPKNIVRIYFYSNLCLCSLSIFLNRGQKIFDLPRKQW